MAEGDGSPEGGVADDRTGTTGAGDGPGQAPPPATPSVRRDGHALVLWSLLSLVLLGGLILVVGPAEVVAPLLGADLRLVALAGLLATTSLGCRHLAYDLLCRRSAASPTGWWFHIYILAAGVPRWLLPFGYIGGPVINATYLVRGVGARFEATVAAFAVAEVLSLLSSGFVLGLGLLLLVATGGTAPTGILLGVGLLFVGLAVAGGVLFALAGRGYLTAATDGSGRRIVGLLARVDAASTLAVGIDRLVGDRIRRFTNSVSTVSNDRRAVAGAYLLNAVAWLVGLLPLYLTARAVGAPVSIGVVMVTVPLAAAAGVVPVPAGLGATEVAYAGLLVTLAGVSPASATAATLLFRLATLGVELAGGAAATLYVIGRRRRPVRRFGGPDGDRDAR